MRSNEFNAPVHEDNPEDWLHMQNRAPLRIGCTYSKLYRTCIHMARK